jgi:prepilin-type N-terminal cleavage/methylation domain-containing protein
MKRKAFTLIELLVVISIIAMLMAIMMPALGKARNMAATKVCASNMRQMAIASTAYASDNNDECVRSITLYNSEDRDGAEPDYNSSWVTWPIHEGSIKPYNIGSFYGYADVNQASIQERIDGIRHGTLYSYLGNEEVLHCPKDKRSSNNAGTGGYRTYSISQAFNGEYWNKGFGPVAKHMSQIRRPSERIFAVEEADPRGANLNSWSLEIGLKGFRDPLVYWHDNGFSIAYADSHAEIFQLRDRRTLDWLDKLENDPASTAYYSDQWSVKGPDANMDLVKMVKAYDNFDAFNDSTGW